LFYDGRFQLPFPVFIRAHDGHTVNDGIVPAAMCATKEAFDDLVIGIGSKYFELKIFFIEGATELIDEIRMHINEFFVVERWH
jgi:hypothetical protein